MCQIKRIRDSQRVVLIGGNVFLKYGVEAMLERDICSDITEEEIATGRGVLLLAPAGTTPQLRIKMLSLVNSMKNSSRWCGINLVDRRDENSIRFSRLTGLPVVDLHLGVDELMQAILFYMEKKRLIRSDSVGGLTPRQWEVLSISLNENIEPGCIKKSTFYNHRMAALRRLRLMNMHELRLLVSDCKLFI
ncbi:hypothetical protein H5Y57_004631 [Salmonella enterica]|nr:hypothetical protein [Salmonella enterica]EBU9565725.1 hypothetical protein [Salmonella enterica subsp. enterica serovar London]EBV4595354.1 hypothetical protein [Salmonella enterica subsp. enterica serovar Eastbourne]EBZ4432482.1 hypothetical protein [Salmonella enterica subsp. enterica serovar Derby]ECA7285533.1 hypothetical protein [Salmonella enterica subsp. enterica serovar Schwarzengrund]ECB6686737.1 hypothetical protein [Salmonella enterica subsp. enterica serovar Poona]ECC9217154.1